MSELKLNKLKMQTPDICEENIKKLKELFPQIVSEDKIDFDILKQLLSNNIVEADDERYRLDWVGKKRSLLKANTPINKTLRPCVEESVDFENTKNLYIEGDNFEVLKLLQESYLNKVKMIYIDPPYNTGKDFIYSDSFNYQSICKGTNCIVSALVEAEVFKEKMTKLTEKISKFRNFYPIISYFSDMVLGSLVHYLA